jgi:hypothetical protein
MSRPDRKEGTCVYGSGAIEYVSSRLALLGTLLLVASPPAVAQVRIPGFEPPPPSCQWTTDDVTKWLVLDTVYVSATDTPVTYVRVASSADTLAIRVPRSGMPSTAAARVSSKSAGNWPFRTVCTGNEPSLGPGARVLLATDPSRSVGSVWRVELKVSRQEHGEQFELLVPRSPAQASGTATAADPWNAASGLLCVDGIPAAQFPRAPPRGFSGRVRLDLDVSQEAYPLAPAQSKALISVVLRAVSLWVVACSGCRAEHLAVVNVGGERFVREEIVKWYADQSRLGAFRSPQFPSPAMETGLTEVLEPVQVLMAGNNAQQWPRAKELSQYKRYLARDFVELCAADAPVSTPVLAMVRRAVCAKPLERDAAAKIMVRFRTTPTACGDDANVIACRTDSELTEYNIRDFRFSFADNRTPALGTGAVELDLLQVIMHEMGHWIELPHLEGESIMASSMETARCIDLPTIAALVGMQRGTHRQAFTGPQAFTLNAVRGSRASRRP